MSAASSEHQWFIAREGKQYGPVSDTELRKLLELGHLKGNDLVWRQGFADWQPAQVLMPAAAPVPTPPPQAAPAPQPAPAPTPAAAPSAAAPAAQPAPNTIRPTQNPQAAAAPTATAPTQPAATPVSAQPQPNPAPRDPARQELSSLSTARPSQRPAGAPTGAPIGGPMAAAGAGMGGYVPPGQQPQQQPSQVQPQPGQGYPGQAHPSQAHPSQGQPGQAHPGQAPAHWPQGMAPAGSRGQQPTFGDSMRGDAMRPGQPQPAPGPMPAPAPSMGQAPGQPIYPNPSAPYASTQPQPGPSLGAAPGGIPQGLQAGPQTGAQPITDRRVRNSLESVSRSGDFEDEDEAPRKRGGAGKKIALALLVLALAGGGGFVLSQGGIDKIAQKLGNAGGAIATAKSGGSAGEGDTRFSGGNLWPVVKKEFPDWYGDRMKDVAKMAAEKKSDEAISKFIIEQLVALRRQNSDSALSASTPKLKDIATAFLANLKSLAGKGTDACYGFISQGETSPAAVEMFRTPAGTPLEAQIKAIFEAIAEGRKSRTTHTAPVKTDYDVLADQLAKLGWGQSDLQLFADPRALAKAAPEKVCKMVQDWFTAHIAIPDAEVQDRLLVETLRPVVSG